MTQHRLQLLNTVKELHEAGTVKLSDADKARIEAETADLIQRSLLNSKLAMKAPPGFDALLEELKKAEDADAAFETVVKFLDSLEGMEVESEEEEEEEESEEEESEAKNGGPEMGEKKPEPPKPKEEKPFPPKPKDEKKPGPPEGGPPKSGLPKPGEPKEDEMKEARQQLLRRAQEQETPEGGISDLQEKKREKAEAPSADEMGVGDMTPVARAAKIKVALTKDRNLVASHQDFGPVFYAMPAPEVKRDENALRRLANKVFGIALYQGFKEAARLCKAKLLIEAGVDDDVVTDSQVEVPPATQGITADEETDTREKPEEGDSSALPGMEVDTREKPPTVSDTKTKMITSKRKRIALASARHRGKDILDEAEGVTQTHKPSKPSGDTTDDAEFNSQETPPAPAGDVLADADNDIRTTQANMSELYKHRLEKRLAAEKEQFVRKFTRALRIAGTRMLLNHEEHPLKVAAVDVLTGEDIEFSDGERYTGMDVGTAVELTELIASEGHESFMTRLLSRAADLLEKDDQYLADAETDLQDQAPVPVGDGGQATARKRSSRNRRSARVRREAAEGNFGKENGAPVSSSKQASGGIRDALSGGTLLGRRIGRLQG